MPEWNFIPPLKVIFNYFKVCYHMAIFSFRLPDVEFHHAFQQARWNFRLETKLLYHPCNRYFFPSGMTFPRGFFVRRVQIKDALPSREQFFLTESPFKMMKNAFYFTLNTLLVLKIFNFCLQCLAMSINDMIRKIKLISKSMTSQLG